MQSLTGDRRNTPGLAGRQGRARPASGSEGKGASQRGTAGDPARAQDVVLSDAAWGADHAAALADDGTAAANAAALAAAVNGCHWLQVSFSQKRTKMRAQILHKKV